MKSKDTALVVIGKIGTTFGIKGWLKIHSYTEFGASIFDYPLWHLSTKTENWETIDVLESKVQGNTLVAKLKSVNSKEEAALFTNKLIAVPRHNLPSLKNNEYYWSDLEGLTVINKSGEILGKVTHLLATGSNDVLVIKNKTEFAIPYLPQVILKVDLENQQIYVDWEEL